MHFHEILQENKHFEDAFQAYEKGVSLFKFPHSKDIWAAYLTKFVARYGGKKLERARDLFRHALHEVSVGTGSCFSTKRAWRRFDNTILQERI